MDNTNPQPEHVATPAAPHSHLLPMVIVGVIMLLVGLAGGYFLFAIKTTVPSTTTQSAQTVPNTGKSVSPTQSQLTDITPLFNTVFQQVKEDSSSFITPPEQASDNKTWWISTAGWSILVPASQSFTAKVRPSGLGVPNKSEFTKLNSSLKTQMTANGFTLNAVNSSDSESDTKFYDYVQAYEKQAIKCVATSSPDVGHGANENQDYSTFTFSCFDNNAFQTAYNQQIPFLKALNDKKAVVSNLQIHGDKAQMEVNWRRTGAAAFMYKTGSTWNLITEGQAAPTCSDLVKNHIPQQYWVDCYDGTTFKKGSF